MKRKYITNLHGHAHTSTAMLAQNMVAQKARELGYEELGVVPFAITNDEPKIMMAKFETLVGNVNYGDDVVVQVPTWGGIAFDELLISYLRERAGKLIVFIHDFVPLMFENNAYLMPRYLEAYNLADVAIVPSNRMGDKLRQNGLVAPIVVQKLWDHLTSLEMSDRVRFRRKLNFAGSCERFPFVMNWMGDVTLDVYSAGESQNSMVNFRGWQHDDVLLRNLSAGFGLVWSEDIENQREKEYATMNASYKLSTYLAAGMPVIMRNGMAKTKIIIENGLGVAFDELPDVEKYVKTVTASEYDEMAERAKEFSFLIRDGFFTEKVLLESFSQAYLRSETDDGL